METHPSLADRFAGLRAIPTTPNPDTTILSAALHALIAAIFARIFGRLEQILQLWQSGQLPAPQPPVLQPRHAARPKRRTRATPRTPKHARRRDRYPPQTAPIHPACALNAPTRDASPHRAAPRRQPSPTRARAPPAAFRRKTRHAR